MKHAIWLVNSRAGSGYPARGIKMPSRDFHGILKMSLFHCSYFIKQLPNGFPSRIAWSMHLGCCSTFGKRKNTLACGSSIFTLSESLATSLVHGSRNPACTENIRYSFNNLCSLLQNRNIPIHNRFIINKVGYWLKEQFLLQCP